MKEIWKESTEVPRYEVSSLGNVRFTDTKKPKYTYKHKSGYIHLTYKESGKQKSKKVHRLVAKEFCDNPESKHCVNHRDGDKSNNVFYNLEWCTHKENMRHAYGNNMIARRGEANSKAKLTENEVHEICKCYEQGIKPKEVIERFGVTRNQAIKIKSKTSWKNITTQYKY